MRDFLKYMHVERYGNDEVQGIELGRYKPSSRPNGLRRKPRTKFRSRRF